MTITGLAIWSYSLLWNLAFRVSHLCTAGAGENMCMFKGKMLSKGNSVVYFLEDPCFREEPN